MLFKNKSKKDEYLFKKEFHEKLEKIIHDKYGVEPQFSENFSWGYTSTSTYIKDVNEKEYVARTSKNTPLKRKLTEKDFAITKDLARIGLSVQLREYMRNKKNEYITHIEEVKDSAGNTLLKDNIIMLHPFISGMPPFKMSEDIFKQAISLLREMHKINPEEFSLELEELAPSKEKLFLHGDMTPSNMLVSYEKISGVVDFELSGIGPAEYDLARTAVFSWFRLEDDYPYTKLIQLINKNYPEKLNNESLKEFSIVHIKSHISNIKKNVKLHKSKKGYKEQLSFAKQKFKELKEQLTEI